MWRQRQAPVSGSSGPLGGEVARRERRRRRPSLRDRPAALAGIRRSPSRRRRRVRAAIRFEGLLHRPESDLSSHLRRLSRASSPAGRLTQWVGCGGQSAGTGGFGGYLGFLYPVILPVFLSLIAIG